MRELSAEENLLISGSGFLNSDPGDGGQATAASILANWQPNYVLRYDGLGGTYIDTGNQCLPFTSANSGNQSLWSQVSTWIQQNCSVNATIGISWTGGVSGGPIVVDCKIVGH